MRPDINNPITIGMIAIDSGQAIIGDPAYLSDWELWDSNNEEFDFSEDQIGKYSYLGASATTLHNEYGELGGGRAVAFNTGYGDGVYPVYAILDEETGKVAQIIIDFTPWQSDEDGTEGAIVGEE
jgi:hypothetical protein